MTDAQRQAVIAEAKTWLKTPYHDHGRKKHVGADCALMPLEVYQHVLQIQAPPLPKYVMQWALHRDEEKYLNFVKSIPGISAVAAPEPGDFALWRIGRVYSHGAIVIAWPKIIHAINPRGVIHCDAAIDPRLYREAVTKPLFFTFG